MIRIPTAVAPMRSGSVGFVAALFGMAVALGACGGGGGSGGANASGATLVSVGELPEVNGLNLATFTSSGGLVGWQGASTRFYWEAVALAPSGDRIARNGDDNHGKHGFVEVYSFVDHKTERVFQTSGCVGDVEWWPDGAWLGVVLGCGPASTKVHNEVVILGADDHVERRVKLPSGTVDFAPSRNGERIAVDVAAIAGRSASSKIDVIELDSGSVKTVRSLPGDLLAGLAWSPDGKQIAYASSRHGLHLMNADGSNDRTLFDQRLAFVSVSPGAFSPDGRRIAVAWEMSNGADEPSLQRGLIFDLNGERPSPTRLQAKGGSIIGPFVWTS